MRRSPPPVTFPSILPREGSSIGGAVDANKALVSNPGWRRSDFRTALGTRSGTVENLPRAVGDECLEYDVLLSSQSAEQFPNFLFFSRKILFLGEIDVKQ